MQTLDPVGQEALVGQAEQVVLEGPEGLVVLVLVVVQVMAHLEVLVELEEQAGLEEQELQGLAQPFLNKEVERP